MAKAAAFLAACVLLAWTPGMAGAATFKHIILVIQENRTPDNLFGSNPTFEPGVDLATSGLNSLGQKVPLSPRPMADCYGLGHGHPDFVAAYDTGKMDGADKVGVTAVGGCILPQNPQYIFVDNSTGTVQPYFDIAKQFGFANRMFQTNQGPTFPAHQFLFGATSAPTATSPLFVAENPMRPLAGKVGCTVDAATRVVVIDPVGNVNSNPPVYPCFERQTLADLLDTAGLSWKYYAAKADGFAGAPNAILHTCVPQLQGGQLVCTGPDWMNNVVLNPAQVLTDIAACNLPSVTWVTPTGKQSDHPIATDGTGPQWVASIVNAVGTNAVCPNGETYWADTAILITWDDWGGFYDHVPPWRNGRKDGWGTGYIYGFRVPLLVVSAFTPAGTVDNLDMDFGSIVRFIEANFRLALISPQNYADAHQHPHALGGFFTLTVPRPFQPIAASLNAAHFISLCEPLEDPDDQ